MAVEFHTVTIITDGATGGWRVELQGMDMRSPVDWEDVEEVHNVQYIRDAFPLLKRVAESAGEGDGGIPW